MQSRPLPRLPLAHASAVSEHGSAASIDRSGGEVTLAPGRVSCAPRAVGGPVDRATLHHHLKTTSWRNE